MNEANLVKLCLPDPPTPTSSALPLSVPIKRDIFIKWTMASLKNTKSIPDPRTVSLYCCKKLISLSSNSGYEGIFKNNINILSFLAYLLVHRSWELQIQSLLAHLQWALEGHVKSRQNMAPQQVYPACFRLILPQ